MPLPIKHFKVSDKADGQDPTLLQPSDWNEDHVFKVEPKKLVGNSTGSLADAEEISISDDFTLEDGLLSLDFNFEDVEVIVSDDADEFPNARVLTSTPTVAWDFATDKQAKANVPDNSITPAKMELSPVGGEILYYDKDSKVLTRLPYGTAGMFLKTGIAAVVGPPAVAAINPSWGFSGAPHVVLMDYKATSGTDGGTFNQNVWQDRVINTERYDLYGLVNLATTDPNNHVFTLGIGTWVVEWSSPAYGVARHQTRLYNNIDAAHPVVYGTSETCGGTAQTRSTGMAQVVVTTATGYKIQHFCTTSKAGDGLGQAVSSTSGHEIYTMVKIWRVA